MGTTLYDRRVAMMALTGFLNERGRRWLIGLTIVGVVIAAPTLVSAYQRLYVESAAVGITDPVRDWSITEAPITAVWGATKRTIRASILPQNDVRLLVRQAGTEYHETADAMPGLKVIALWWWMLPAAHIPAWIGALAALAMVVTRSVLVAQGLRLARGIDDHSVGAEAMRVA